MLYNLWLQDPANLALLADLLAELQTNNDFELMSEVVQRLTAEVSVLPWVKLYRVQLCMVTGNYSDATALAKTVTEHDDEYNMSRLLLAQICFLQGDYEGAGSYLKTMTRVDATSAALTMRCLHFCGCFTEALAFFNSLPNDVVSTECLGLAALITADSGDPVHGLTLAEQVIAVDPRQADALVAAAYSLIDLQQYERAKPIIGAGLDCFPKLGRLWSMQGQIYLINSEHLRATHAFEQAVHWMPDHVGTWLLRGWNHGLQQHWLAAQADFETAVALDRNFAESHAALAVAALKLAKIEQAESALAKAKRLDSQAFTVAYATALLAEIQGRPDESERLIRQLLNRPHYRGHGSYADLISRQLKQDKRVDH